MNTWTWRSRAAAALAVCTIAAVAASGMAAPPGDQGDHKDRHVQDNKGNKHGDHTNNGNHGNNGNQGDKGHHGNNGKAPKKHGAHDNGRHNGNHGGNVVDQSAVWRHRREVARQRELQRLADLDRRYHRPRYVVTHGNDDWRNIAILAGLVAVVGLVEHDDTLTFIGAAGALYSLTRYEHDRHSHNRADRLRAVYFSRPYFYRNGHRYRRTLVRSHGQKYYRFVR